MADSIISALHNNITIFTEQYRYKQLNEALFQKALLSFNSITTLPLSIREELAEKFSILDITEENRLISKDGTVKFLFKLSDGNYIESVFLKDINNRVTFCISTQCGCRMGCIFCKTGKMGLIRNLNYSEIISQILYLNNYQKYSQKIDDKKFNIVFMGMGEPLDNLENLLIAIQMLVDKNRFAISQSRITVSTCGIIDKLDLLLEKFHNIKIAISLNTAIQQEREKIMPIAKKFGIEKLVKALKDIYSKYKNRITLEYVLIKNYNMSEEHIKALELFKEPSFHINLIPLNHSDENIKRPDEKEITEFYNKLKKRNFCVTRRYRRGADINADCGQLFYNKNVNLHCERIDQKLS